MRTFHRLPLVITQALILFLLPGCGILDDLMEQPKPTKARMEGIWKVSEAYDDNGNSILNKINFPVTAFQLNDESTVISTAGPMFMYIVYGGSKYVQIASDIDQVFKYANLNFTGGQWTCADGVTDRFTIEVNLQGAPGQSTLKSLLQTLNIQSQYLNFLNDIIYHKFMDVHVTFDDYSDSVMTWEFDNTTTASYNMKDQNLNYVLWQGWPTTSFSHCKFVLTKQVKDMEDLVKEAAQN